jgi:hypothetical protein
MRSPSGVARGPAMRRTSVNAGDVDHSTNMRAGRSERLHTTALEALTSPLWTPQLGIGTPLAVALARAAPAARAPGDELPEQPPEPPVDSSAADAPSTRSRRPSL